MCQYWVLCSNPQFLVSTQVFYSIFFLLSSKGLLFSTFPIYLQSMNTAFQLTVLHTFLLKTFSVNTIALFSFVVNWLILRCTVDMLSDVFDKNDKIKLKKKKKQKKKNPTMKLFGRKWWDMESSKFFQLGFQAYPSWARALRGDRVTLELLTG